LNRIVLTSGGFDPLHSGHIKYLNEASKLGDKLIVGVNSDAWLSRKKGRPFIRIVDRSDIIENLKMVDECWRFSEDFDTDGTCIKMIENALHDYPNSIIIFANGGDRTEDNIPEMNYFKENERVQFIFGVGGEDKKNSSSWILNNWKTQKTAREWGYWRVLDDKETIKVKELVINPGCSLSDQRHKYRKEHWYILKGKCEIRTEWYGSKNTIELIANDYFIIEKYSWHKTTNTGDEPCHILEVQYGEKCIEEDIERR
jgi:cytidyltransferase-like protein